MRPRGFRKTKTCMISFLSRRKISLRLEENATHNKTKESARNSRNVRKAAQIWRPYKETCEKEEWRLRILQGLFGSVCVLAGRKRTRDPDCCWKILMQLKETPLFKHIKWWCYKQYLAPELGRPKCAQDLPRRCLGAARVGTRWKFSVGARGPKSKGSSSEK